MLYGKIKSEGVHLEYYGPACIGVVGILNKCSDGYMLNIGNSIVGYYLEDGEFDFVTEKDYDTYMILRNLG